jgi:hypothetical protein
MTMTMAVSSDINFHATVKYRLNTDVNYQYR